MRDEYVFRPERRMGLIFHIASLIVLIFIGLGSLILAVQSSDFSTGLLTVLPAAVIVSILPALAYRIYALQSAAYILERNGIRLRWGLRSQDIPIQDVLWVHPANELTAPLPLPFLRMPGAILGRRRLPGDGEIEYLAGDLQNMLMIATPEGGYVISPQDPEEFLQIYQRFTEMGSLATLPSRAVYPSFLLQRVWSARAARSLLLSGVLLSLILLIWVSLLASGQQQVPMGFLTDGSPGDRVPAANLMFLPILNLFFLFVNIFLGLFFYRRQESFPIAYTLWGGAVLTTILFLLAVLFISQNI